MAFTPMLSKPEKGNKYYITKAKCGYSTAIQGQPTDPDLDVLSNCFTGDTEIITREGVVRLDSIVDKTVEVLSKDGKYHTAIGGYYGKQQLYRVTFNNGEIVECTGNHRWLVCHISKWNGKIYKKYLFKRTIDLNYHHDLIPYNIIDDVEYNKEAVKHGFVYGDGSYYNNKSQSQANLCGFKKEYMIGYFKDSLHKSLHSNGTLCCYPYPKEYKEVPDIAEHDLSYLRGFIIGLLASDGCVDKYGCVTISTCKFYDAQKISNILSVLGYYNKILSELRDTNYNKGSWLYRVSIKKNFIKPDLLLNPFHNARYYGDQNVRFIKYTKIRSVEKTDRIEKVYCVSEPETHTMTLKCGIVTGQCVGYAVGRFHEIAGDPTFSLVSPINAENIYADGISKGLKASQTPQLGAIAVWQKGPTLSSSDGCGHVAIVEVINADGSIVTSESGYGCTIPFQTFKRVKGKDGNWGNGSGYKFLGFLLQPKSVNPDTFTPYTIRLKYGEPIYQISDGVAKQVSMITVESIYTIVYEETLGVEKYGKLKSGVGWVLLESNVTDLKRGSAGDDVKWLQQRLIDKGYMSKGEVDGSFGKKTMSGVLGFQFDNNLEITGVCDAKTRELLKK